MGPLPLRIKRPTPEEWAVIIVFFSFIFIAFGIVALVVAFRAPPEKHSLAVPLAHLGFWSLGIGGAIAVGFWLIRHLRQSI